MNRTLIGTLAFGLLCAALGAGVALLWPKAHSEPPAPKPEEAAGKKKSEAPDYSRPVRRQLVDSRSRTLELEQLQALGYVDGTYDPRSDLSDVVVHVEGKTSPGYNFYASRRQAGARLIDMDGRTLHEWEASEPGAWQHAELMPNGDVLVIVKDRRLSRYDRDSNLIWSVAGRFHHDLWIHDGQIYILSRRTEVIQQVHESVPTLVDLIQVRSPEDGSLVREISIVDVMAKSSFGFLLPSIAHEKRNAKRGYLDILHTNHVEVLDGALADRGSLYAKGNMLISMRNINAIAILDGETAEVLWIWGPTNLTFQHHPALLRNGNILLFDNGLKRSRVLEVDPLSLRIQWQYAPKSGFLSKTRGSVQRLPNGNTLITESDKGYVLEVTRKNQVVWKFANPVVNKKKEREAIWRMKRFAPQTLSFLN